MSIDIHTIAIAGIVAFLLGLLFGTGAPAMETINQYININNWLVGICYILFMQLWIFSAYSNNKTTREKPSHFFITDQSIVLVYSLILINAVEKIV